jgi:hypothetical protein
MALNFVVTWSVSRFTPEPPARIQVLVDLVRLPETAKKERTASAGG